MYMAKCKDGSIYTGITTDIERRIKEHNHDSIKGAKSLRGKRPVKLVYFEEFQIRFEAASRELEIKKWQRVNKLKLINSKRLGVYPQKV